MKKTDDAIKVTSWSVDNVRNMDWGVLFNLTVNGVTIYSCRLVEHGDDIFIGFPSYKGNNGKYYNHVYCRFGGRDEENIIRAVKDAI